MIIGAMSSRTSGPLAPQSEEKNCPFTLQGRHKGGQLSSHTASDLVPAAAAVLDLADPLHVDVDRRRETVRLVAHPLAEVNVPKFEFHSVFPFPYIYE